MGPRKLKGVLKVTFHNPNSTDETGKLLIKIIADGLTDYVISKKSQLLRRGDLKSKRTDI